MRNKGYFIYILISYFFSTEYVKSQDPYIFSNDPYTGISTVGLSPTQPFLNPNNWDVQLFSEDLFFQNDYGYLSKTSLLGLIGKETREVDIENNITGKYETRF